jgi:hypothetical protein
VLVERYPRAERARGYLIAKQDEPYDGSHNDVPTRWTEPDFTDPNWNDEVLEDLDVVEDDPVVEDHPVGVERPIDGDHGEVRGEFSGRLDLGLDD